ncbi:DUF6807 domain-containing protein [Rubinisphaera margarita]|uniref:DUF6807 domain-containing protein n=1 Tax=Rubinisphaera margarita TaxID=2909586 RepID=UPI001EE881B2|nr:PmoA family protein [Rubinisphaera margarita]MCG6155786.1 PmoA family protein [Rubinisphaera margarita]
MRFLWCCLPLVLSTIVSAAEPEFILTIVPGGERKGHLPVSIELPDDVRDGNWELLEPTSGRQIPAQTVGNRLVFTQSEKWTAGSVQSFEMRAAELPSKSEFNWNHSQGDLTLARNDRPVLNYNVAIDEPPSGLDPLYRRSGYFHPVYTPAGNVLTADFPADHAHQHGIFFAWVKTTIDGKPVDFWNQAKGQGTVLHKALEKPEQGSEFASFQAELEHLTQPTSESQTALREQWTVSVFPSDRFHLWELRSTQRNVLDVPITLEKYHYGGMAFRGSVDWIISEDNDDCTMLTSEGSDRQQGNHESARWVKITGPTADSATKHSRCGLVMMAHPDNVRFPQKVRLHPTKPYFCFCPVIDEQLVLEPGDVLQSRYLFLTFDGDPKSEVFEQIWSDYVCEFDVKLQ